MWPIRRKQSCVLKVGPAHVTIFSFIRLAFMTGIDDYFKADSMVLSNIRDYLLCTVYPGCPIDSQAGNPGKVGECEETGIVK